MNASAGKLSFTRAHLYEALLVLAFLLLCGFDLWHHAMWRDEMQPWVYARDSASIPEMFRNMRYETHPRLWYVILWGVARFAHNPVAAQITHLIVVGSAIALFVRYCPVAFYLKALITFGYYFVYEWGAITRNYSLGALLCFVFCILFPRRDKGYLGLAVILFLITQANLYAAALAASLGGLLMLEACLNPEVRSRAAAHKVDAALSFVLLYGGVLRSFQMAVTQPDAGIVNFVPGVTVGDRLAHAFAAAWDGFVPFPEPSLLGAWGWGMTGHTVFGPPAIHAILGAILLTLTTTFFWRSRLILLAYLGGTGVFLLLAFIKADTYARQAGYFYLWLLVCLWLAHYFPVSSASRQSASKPEKKRRSNARDVKPVGAAGRPFGLARKQTLLLCSILAVHIFDTVFLSIAGYYYNYSCGKAAALYLEQHDLTKLPIFGYPDYTAMLVSGYADVPIYYPDTHRWGSFLIENNKRRCNWTPNQIMDAINDFAAQGHRDFVVLLSRPFMFQREGQVFEPEQLGNLHRLASFYPCMVGDEIYWIYRYTAAP